jgi:hypothetical protein
VVVTLPILYLDSGAELPVCQFGNRWQQCQRNGNVNQIADDCQKYVTEESFHRVVHLAEYADCGNCFCVLSRHSTLDLPENSLLPRSVFAMLSGKILIDKGMADDEIHQNAGSRQ